MKSYFIKDMSVIYDSKVYHKAYIYGIDDDGSVILCSKFGGDTAMEEAEAYKKELDGFLEREALMKTYIVF